MSTHQESSIRPAPVPTDPGRGGRQERSARLDQLEREIAIERDRLNRPDDGDPAPRSGTGDRHPDSVRRVDLPELEKVTESQREAWALGYQAGIADSQTRTGEPSPEPVPPAPRA